MNSKPSLPNFLLSRKHIMVSAAVRWVWLLILIHLFLSVAAARSLADYRLRLQSAVNALDTLAQHDESETEAARATRITTALNAIRAGLPEKDKVEIGNATVEVNNAWLHRELEAYEKKPDEREVVITRTLERLRALEERVTEFDQAGRATTDKTESKRRLTEILSRPEYANQPNEENALVKLFRKLKEWLEKLLPKPKLRAPGSPGFVSQIVQVVIIVLALAVIAYVIVKFAPRMFRGGRRKKKPKREARVVLGETLAPDQSAGDILGEAEALARRGELRAAIRKAYIALLVELGDRKVLSLAQNKTNRDYLRAMRDREPLHTDVKQLTDSFERHWYGFVLATNADWDAFKSRYAEALRSLN